MEEDIEGLSGEGTSRQRLKLIFSTSGEPLEAAQAPVKHIIKQIARRHQIWFTLRYCRGSLARTPRCCRS